MGACPSRDGVGPHVPVLKEWIKYMREQWQEVGMMKLEVSSSSVFMKSPSSSTLVLDCKLTKEGFTERSTKLMTIHQHLATCYATMLHVLYATLQYATPRSPYPQGHHVLLHGQWNSMATTCPDTSSIRHTSVELQRVWMLIQNQFQEVPAMIVNPTCTF